MSETIIRFQLGEGLHLALVAPEGFSALEGSHTVQLACEQFAGALATMRAKDRQYGGAWREQGWMGNLARIMSKTARLRNMLWRDYALSDAAEPVRDTLQDLMNLCVFMLLNLNGGNRWGRGDGPQ